ncbi:MAG TPA: CapA family protein [Candidatus Limiplasma sp.]|nr:CapA family protein [Candidatus Limiplasma sp.]
MHNRRNRSDVSIGTVATLVVLALVIIGCAVLFPKLLGHVEQRVSAQQVSVALENSFHAFSDSVLAQQTTTAATVAATAPPAVATATPEAAATPVPVQKLTITAAGEISIDRTIQSACTNDTGYNFGFLFEQLKSRLTSDINLATLQNIVIPEEQLTDTNMPSAALTGIASGGFNVLCTGFYGALDGGLDGLRSTLSLIEQNGMLPYGTYLSADDRTRVVTMDVNGLTVAFLSFQGELSATGKKATTKEEQSYVFAQLTLPAITTEINAARAAGAKIVIVSLCWGRENATEPTKLQTELAQGIAAAGADIILGTNPGVLQTVDILTSIRDDGTQRQTLCAYSLGSIVNSDRTDRTVLTSILLHMNLKYNLQTDVLTFETITYTPVYIWRGKYNGDTAFQPVISNADPPDYMNEDQQGVMGRSLNDVRRILTNSLVQER